jgi:hypothetical protein
MNERDDKSVTEPDGLEGNVILKLILKNRVSRGALDSTGLR